MVKRTIIASLPRPAEFRRTANQVRGRPTQFVCWDGLGASSEIPELSAASESVPHYNDAMTIDQLREEAAERIRAVHRRARDNAVATQVTITEGGPHFDRVRVEYADGEVRVFERCRPVEHEPS